MSQNCDRTRTGRKQRAQRCHSLSRLLRKAGPHTPALCCVRPPTFTCQQFFSCLWNVSWGGGETTELSFHFLMRTGFPEHCPCPYSSGKEVAPSPFSSLETGQSPPSRTCSLFLPETLPWPHTDPNRFTHSKIMTGVVSPLSTCTSALVNAHLCSQPQ